MTSKILTFALTLCLLAGVSQADTILHFDDFTGGTQSVAAALAQLGETATTATSATFAATLASQSWDLVIVDISSSGIGANSSVLINYISGGGTVIMSYFPLQVDAALATSFEASVASTFFSLMPVYAWSGAHPIFTAPYSVSSPVGFGPELLGDNGDRLNAIGGGVSVAGFVSTPTAGQGAIIVGNGGRTILNGWSFDEISGANGVNLVANEIRFALNSAPAVPEPSSMALVGLGLAALLAKRRRAPPLLHAPASALVSIVAMIFWVSASAMSAMR